MSWHCFWFPSAWNPFRRSLFQHAENMRIRQSSTLFIIIPRGWFIKWFILKCSYYLPSLNIWFFGGPSRLLLLSHCISFSLSIFTRSELSTFLMMLSDRKDSCFNCVSSVKFSLYQNIPLWMLLHRIRMSKSICFARRKQQLFLETWWHSFPSVELFLLQGELRDKLRSFRARDTIMHLGRYLTCILF